MKVFCTLAFVVVAAFFAQAHHHPNHHVFDMKDCVDMKKFSAFASTPEGCSDLAESTGTTERHDHKDFMDGLDCFLKAGGYFDKLTNTTNVKGLKDAVEKIVFDDKIAPLDQIIDDCNTNKAETLVGVEGMEFGKCYFEKVKELCKKTPPPKA